MSCSRCRGTDPSCDVCHDVPDPQEPWTEGMDAAIIGRKQSANPYRGQDGRAWDEGWEYGKSLENEP